jgi:signal peptidase II
MAAIAVPGRAMPARVLLLSATLLFLLDQSAKALALARLGDGRTVALGVMTLRVVLNRPAEACAIRSRVGLAALWVTVAAALGVLVQLGPFFQGAVAPVALGAALGGAGSNLVDRLWRRGVVDLVDLRVWPVFNLADVAIVGGAVIGALHL